MKILLCLLLMMALAGCIPIGLRTSNLFPELANADPDWFGICIVTADGYAYAVGDCDHPFTIQSVSKPVVYATALADRGRDRVLRKVGVGQAAKRSTRSVSIPNPVHRSTR